MSNRENVRTKQWRGNSTQNEFFRMDRSICADRMKSKVSPISKRWLVWQCAVGSSWSKKSRAKLETNRKIIDEWPSKRWIHRMNEERFEHLHFDHVIFDYFSLFAIAISLWMAFTISTTFFLNRLEREQFQIHIAHNARRRPFVTHHRRHHCCTIAIVCVFNILLVSVLSWNPEWEQNTKHNSRLRRQLNVFLIKFIATPASDRQLNEFANRLVDRRRQSVRSVCLLSSAIWRTINNHRHISILCCDDRHWTPTHTETDWIRCRPGRSIDFSCWVILNVTGASITQFGSNSLILVWLSLDAHSFHCVWSDAIIVLSTKQFSLRFFPGTFRVHWPDLWKFSHAILDRFREVWMILQVAVDWTQQNKTKKKMARRNIKTYHFAFGCIASDHYHDRLHWHCRPNVNMLNSMSNNFLISYFKATCNRKFIKLWINIFVVTDDTERTVPFSCRRLFCIKSHLSGHCWRSQANDIISFRWFCFDQFASRLGQHDKSMDEASLTAFDQQSTWIFIF